MTKTTTKDVQDLQFQVMEMYLSGKSRLDMVGMLEANGVASSSAEAMADAGIEVASVPLSMMGEREKALCPRFFEVVKHVSNAVDEGKSKKEIHSWLIKKGHSDRLASVLIEVGLDAYALRVKIKKGSLKNQAYLFGGMGFLVIWAHGHYHDSNLLLMVGCGLFLYGLKSLYDAGNVQVIRLPH